MASDLEHIPSHRKLEAAMRIVQRLQEHGHIAYFAGGCVRDRIMGREPTDYDVATDAPTPRVLELFRRARKVGQAFGVVMVGVDEEWIEVATFRTEWGYADHRHPDHVEFSDAQHDAQRRDFTINGLFYDPVADEVIDYIGGRRDIEARIIRAIGQPRHRFEEDYLRMLRAVRFAARLEFSIEPETAAAIREHAGQLSGISRERIGQEVRMMLEHHGRAQAARLMQDLELDGPALGEPHVEHEPAALAALPEDADFPAALAAWAIDRHLQPERPDSSAELLNALRRLKSVAITRHWREALVLSNDECDAMVGALRALPQAADWPALPVAQRKRLLARGDWERIRSLLGAVNKRAGGVLPLDELDRSAQMLRAEGVDPAPLITGDDLLAAGLPPGPLFRQLLDSVYDAQLEGRVTTRDQALELAKSSTGS